MRSFQNRILARRHVVIGAALVAALATGVVLGLAVTTPAEAQAARTFSGGAGMMLNYISPDASDQFESVMRKVAEALRTSDNPERNAQANGWSVYRAQEPGPNNAVLYVWIIDPAVQGADYAVSQILNEAFPGEVQELYEQFSSSFSGGQSMVNLDLVVEF